jgi:ABC-type transporter Mla subunit MlaD
MRRVLPSALVVVAIVLAGVLISGRPDGHEVRFTVAHATGLARGFDVKLGGRSIGSISGVRLTPDYRARITLRIDDGAWPLPRDTVFKARLGGAIKFGDRYLETVRGQSDVSMRDGDVLAASQYVDPVEFDGVLNTFDRPTRAGLADTVEAMGLATPGLARHLPRALVDGPAAATSVERVLGQLGADPQALDTLVRSAAGVAESVTDANPGVGELIANADATFAALASRTRQMQTLLAEAPATLQVARGALDKTAITLASARELTRRLAPGVAELRATARPLAGVLRAVRDIGPSARVTLATLRVAAPQLDGLLERVRRPLMPQVESIGREAAKQLNCIRPYAPEIAGLASTWTGFFSRGDGKDKFIRAQAGTFPYFNEIPVNSGQLQQLLGSSFKMAYPRPPGELAGQPWFQPECGITEAALDPAKDPDALAVAPTSKPLVDLGSPGGER